MQDVGGTEELAAEEGGHCLSGQQGAAQVVDSFSDSLHPQEPQDGRRLDQ